MSSRISLILSETVGPKVLDVGCTGGLQTQRPVTESPLWMHQHIVERFDDVWGIDISDQKVKFLHDRGYSQTRAADAQDFTLEESFDTIIAGELIEHLENPGQFLRSAARHLRPGGRIVLTTPYAAGLPNLMYAWVKYPKTCANPEHTMWFCPSTIGVLADRANLQVKEIRLLDEMTAASSEHGRLYRILQPLYARLGKLLPLRMRATGMLIVLSA